MLNCVVFGKIAICRSINVDASTVLVIEVHALGTNDGQMLVVLGPLERVVRDSDAVVPGKNLAAEEGDKPEDCGLVRYHGE